MSVFFVPLHGFQRTQTTQLTFHGDAQFVRHADHFLSHFNVVFVTGNGFAIGLQTAIHHDGAETQIDSALAHIGALTVILVHHHGYLGIGLNRRLNEQL